MKGERFFVKATNFVRRVGRFGRVALPKSVRKATGIDWNSFYEVFVENGNIIIKKYVPRCVFCGEATNDSNRYFGVRVCPECAFAVSQLFSK